MGNVTLKSTRHVDMGFFPPFTARVKCIPMFCLLYCGASSQVNLKKIHGNDCSTTKPLLLTESSDHEVAALLNLFIKHLCNQ